MNVIGGVVKIYGWMIGAEMIDTLYGKNDAKTRRLRKTNCPYLCRNCVLDENETAACIVASGCL